MSTSSFLSLLFLFLLLFLSISKNASNEQHEKCEEEEEELHRKMNLILSNHFWSALKTEYEETESTLRYLEIFIKFHKHDSTKKMVVFDLDGTLIHEKVFLESICQRYLDECHCKKSRDECERFAQRVSTGSMGQIVHTMLGMLYKNYSEELVLPRLRNDFCQITKKQMTVSYVGEGQSASAFHVYSSIVTFVEGMKKTLYQDFMREILRNIETEYYFKPMFDVMNLFLEYGFEVVVITGANQYFAEVVMEDVKKKEGYTYNMTGKVFGNRLVIDNEGKFTGEYDDSLLENDFTEVDVVNGKGKVKLIKLLEKEMKKSFVLAVGNSCGDFEMLEYVSSLGGNGIVVDPKKDGVNCTRKEKKCCLETFDFGSKNDWMVLVSSEVQKWG